MDDLVQWLRAVLDDEAAAQSGPEAAWHRRDCGSLPDVLYPGQETGACDCGVPARVLRGIEAKRRLLAIHRPYVPEPDQACLGCAGGIMFTSCPVVRLLALPYADRPGYREEWRP